LFSGAPTFQVQCACGQIYVLTKNGEKMLKKIFPIVVLLAIVLTACGPQGTPTPSPEEVQGTAEAAAWTMVAMTQEAIPTNTPVPPTETPSPTPLPTFTALPEPTLELIIPTATQVAASGGSDNCLKPLNMGEAGPTSPVRIENTTGGNIRVSLNLQNNPFGQCGALYYEYAKNAKSVVNLPRGDWWAWIWINVGGKESTASCSFTIRVSDFDMQRLIVEANRCRVTGA
jgi:hypothetical protein